MVVMLGEEFLHTLEMLIEAFSSYSLLSLFNNSIAASISSGLLIK